MLGDLYDLLGFIFILFKGFLPADIAWAFNYAKSQSENFSKSDLFDYNSILEAVLDRKAVKNAILHGLKGNNRVSITITMTHNHNHNHNHSPNP